MNQWGRPVLRVFALAFAVTAAAAAQQTPAPSAPTPGPAPTPAPDLDLRMIRYKISAGDLPSAESILEVHRAEKGEDEDYVYGVAWLARGAVLVGDWTAAAVHAKRAREIGEALLKTPADWESKREAVYALGTAIEVQAQVLVASGKKAEALRLLDESSRSLEKAPYNIRARVWKRRNQIELVGQKAPPIQAEESLGAAAPSLESLKGKPVVLFFWWEACGDCKMQAAAFKRTVEAYAGKGVAFVAPTRFYRPAVERAEERGKMEKAWKETYAVPASVTVSISDAAMLRYGVSATPTFVFVDRKGNVVRYLPYRMSQERLAAAIDEILK